jgi:hypothetical protein
VVRRTSYDDAGDTAIALILLCQDARSARALVDATRARGLSSTLLFDPKMPDFHVAYHWTPIIERRTWSARGPWDFQADEVSYERDRWARTTEILGRAFHLDISPDLSAGQAAAIGAVVHDALAAL